MRNLAIIPARSGSKGLPNKNIKELNGKPLIAYSIEAAINSRCFNTVMVSTDSKKYADVAARYGADVPFLRSRETSLDNASSWDTVEEVLQKYECIGKEFDTFCLLQPTSPMRSAIDICMAYDLYEKRAANAIVSMTELEHPIEWCGLIDEDLSLERFNNENDVRRQELKVHYRPNGAIYIFSVVEFRQNRNLYRKGAYAYIMPRERSVDIDTEFDFDLAEFLIKKNEAFKNV